MFTCCVLSAVY